MTISPGERRGRGGLHRPPGAAADLGGAGGAADAQAAPLPRPEHGASDRAGSDAAAQQLTPDADAQQPASHAATPQPASDAAAPQPARDASRPQSASDAAAPTPDARAPGGPGDRPPSRRELREQERRRTAVVPDGAAPAAPSPVVASLAALARRVPSGPSPTRPSVEPRTPESGVADDAGPHPHPEPDHEDLAPHEAYRYTWKHLGVLAAVAGVLGFLIWTQSTADGSGADGARAADPTTSSSLTRTRGEP